MKAAFLLRVLSATSLLVNANANSIDHQQQQQEDSLDDFIKDQQQISLQGMLDNIVEAPYPDLHGMVVASRSDTDCICLELTKIDGKLTTQTGTRGSGQLH